MGSWEDLVSFLTSLAEEDRACFSRYAAMDLPGEPDALAATLRAYAEENPAATASDLLAFEKHCRAALYEYRGDRGEAARVCRRAVEVLEAAGDTPSAERFRERLRRLSREAFR